MQIGQKLLHKATCFTRHQQGTEKMTVMFTERTNSAVFSPRLCTLFFIFEECARFCFFEERRKQGDNVFAYSSKPLTQLVLSKSFFLRADPGYFWSLLFILFLWYPLLSLLFTTPLVKEQLAQPLWPHSSNLEDPWISSAFRECLPCIISNSVTVVKMWYLQAAKWWPLVRRDVDKAFWLIFSVP